MKKFANFTHYLALGAAGVVAFAATPAGEALVKQYPHLTAAVALAGLVAALYHNPAKPQP